MTGSPDSHKSQELAFALQKYLLLHSQHDAIHKKIESLPRAATAPSSPTRKSSRSHRNSSSSMHLPPTSNIGGQYPSSAISPISEDDFELSSYSSRPRLQTRRSSLPPRINPATAAEAAEEEHKLEECNQQIKLTLTKLLNCDSVRRDAKYRTWVQSRLMDAEMELRSSKSRSCSRRRSVDYSTMCA
jgi:hypothetical protein